MYFDQKNIRGHFDSPDIFANITRMIEIFFKHNFYVMPYVPRESRRNPSNRRLNEYGIYIRHCQESNSQPVPSQAGADTTRSQ